MIYPLSQARSDERTRTDTPAGLIEEVVGVPGGGQRPGLRLAVADDAGDEQLGVVEGGAVRVRQGVAELAAFVHRARRLGRVVARDGAGEGELGEGPLQARLVLGDVRIPRPPCPDPPTQTTPSPRA